MSTSQSSFEHLVRISAQSNLNLDRLVKGRYPGMLGVGSGLRDQAQR
jgi:hypothetical protein